MRTHHNVDKESQPPPQVSPPVWDKPTFPVQSFPPPQPPPRPKRNRWAAIAAIVVVLALALGLGAAFVPGLVRGPGSQVTPAPTAPTAPSTRMTPTPGTATTPKPGTPGTDGVIPAPIGPGTETTPAPVPGVVLGPRACPPGIGDPARWNAIIGTNNGERQVVSISCANIMDNPSQQAMVLVRHNNTNATLDVYVFNNITSSHPTRIFLLQGLIKGNARISGYNTIMTAEVDRNAAHNAGKPVSAMTPDLFREFDWSAAKGTLVQTAFPGIFPDLTRYQAEADQAQVRAGHQPWKNDAQAVSKALATTFFDWKRSITTKLLSGGGAKDVSATVLVQEAFPQGASGQGPSVRVTLSRLEGNARNMWVVIAVEDTTMLTLKNIDARSLITSPVTLEGTGAAFEAVIGRAVVYDHAYADVGHAQITGDRGMGNANYTTNVVYTTTFKAGPQEGIVAVYEANGGISDEIYTAVMRKVLLSPEPGVALGEVPCPAAVGDPAHWTPFVSKPPRIAVAERVTCGNLLDRPGLQAMVVAREIVGGGPLFRSVFIFDNITAQEPKLLFKVEHMLHGDARISGYNTIMTAEVDTSSALNKGKGDAALTVDLFREFDWSAGTGTFTQVVFPGLYPDLTRYQAEADQRLVNNGQDGWKNDAVQTTQHMVAALLSAHAGTAQAKLVKGGGKSDLAAVVQVTFPAERTQNIPITRVTLSRLEGNLNGIWEVTGVQADWLRLDTPTSGATISSPVTITGFGPQFEAQIGVVYILDHLYQQIQTGDNFAMAPDGASPPSRFSLPVKYTSSFRGGAQEGIVELIHGGGASFDYGATLAKVLISG
jgi:hypothetical protein